MPLTPANALTYQVTWGDFGKPVPMTAPGPGEVKQAAKTAVSQTVDLGELHMAEVKGSKPPVYKLEQEPTANVKPDKESMWVASFVFDDWPAAKRDALLGHEQIHYLIGALSGRDYSNDFAAIKAKSYPSIKAGNDDIRVALARYTKEMVQELQDAYDKKTKHDPTGFKEEQAKWATAVLGAKTTGKPLRSTLKLAGLIP